jgi:hypothetical protein
MLTQVTRLACGGFVLAVQLNHTMAGAQGLMQFLGAVAELARGDAQAPMTVQPVWERHLLEGRRNSPQPRDKLDDDSSNSSNIMLPLLSLDNMVLCSFFFGPEKIATIRAQLSSSPDPDLHKRMSRFNVIAGWLWKYRTMALAPDSNEPMLMIVVVNARGRTGSAGIPTSYYVTTATRSRSRSSYRRSASCARTPSATPSDW